MIFVTVGTHEQQFDRLIEYIDKLAMNVEEKIILQTGFSTYVPKFCIWKKIFSYEEMSNIVIKARIIITHGGPSSFIAPLRIGKIPIVVPRKKIFGEHVNDHQLLFCREVYARYENIILVENIENLYNVIRDYDIKIAQMKHRLKSNNDKFCSEFSQIVDGLF